MLEYSTRRLLSVVTAAAVCTVATIVGAAAPAHAAPTGYLLTKGTGSVYSANEIINLGVIPGGSAKTWSYKVVNTSASSEQFKVKVTPGDSTITATLKQGTKVLPHTYYSALIAPGGSLVLTLQISIASGASAAQHSTYVELRDPETNTGLDSAIAVANATYQTGNTAHDVFVKTGSQPLVGGSVVQFETANALKVGSTATFVVRLKNDSGTPGSMTVGEGIYSSCAADFTVVVKRGTTNVTAAVQAGTYTTGALAPGAKQDLKVLVKLVRATSCTNAYVGLTAAGPDGTGASYAHVVTAA